MFKWALLSAKVIKIYTDLYVWNFKKLLVKNVAFVLHGYEKVYTPTHVDDTHANIHTHIFYLYIIHDCIDKKGSY